MPARSGTCCDSADPLFVNPVSGAVQSLGHINLSNRGLEIRMKSYSTMVSAGDTREENPKLAGSDMALVLYQACPPPANVRSPLWRGVEGRAS